MKPVFFLFSIIFFSYSCDYKAKPDSNNRQEISTENWTTIKEYDLTFSIPSNMVKQDVHGRDNLYVQYSNDEMSVSFESGVGSDTLQNLDSYGDVEIHEKKEINNEGVKGIQIDYQYLDKANLIDKNKRFVKSAGFDCSHENSSVTFSILFAHPKSSDIAEKIIQSISLRCS